MPTSTMPRLVWSMGAMLVLMTTSPEGQAPTPGTATPSAFAAPQAAGAAVQEEGHITTTKMTNNFYRFEGFNNSGALFGPDGVFLVDTQEGAFIPKLLAAIRQISDGPIRFVVNTHVHQDHTGGNETFAKTGAVIMAREELRMRKAQHNLSAGAPPVWRPPAPPAALPMVTYRGPTTIRMNGDEVQLIHPPGAHTDGDTMVRFLVADVLMMGDVFRMSGYPNVDLSNGGSVKGTIAALGVAIDASGPNTKVLPGHGAVTDRAMLIATRDMMTNVRDRVAALAFQGKTADEAVATKPTGDYDKYVPGGSPATAERFVRQIYAEIAAEGKR